MGCICWMGGDQKKQPMKMVSWAVDIFNIRYQANQS